MDSMIYGLLFNCLAFNEIFSTGPVAWYILCADVMGAFIGIGFAIEWEKRATPPISSAHALLSALM